MAVETTGVLGPSTLRILLQLGKRITVHTGDKRETSWLFQRIFIAIIRGIAAAITVTGENLTI